MAGRRWRVGRGHGGQLLLLLQLVMTRGVWRRVRDVVVMQLIALVVGGVPVVVTATRRLFAWERVGALASARVGRITPE